MSGELKNPDKDLPRAMVGSAFLVIFIYVMTNIAIMGLMPFNHIIASKAPIADGTTNIPMFSGIASSFIVLDAAVIMFGGLNSAIMIKPRLQYAMAKDKLFFSSFA